MPIEGACVLERRRGEKKRSNTEAKNLLLGENCSQSLLRSSTWNRVLCLSSLSSSAKRDLDAYHRINTVRTVG